MLKALKSDWSFIQTNMPNCIANNSSAIAKNVFPQDFLLYHDNYFYKEL